MLVVVINIVFVIIKNNYAQNIAVLRILYINVHVILFVVVKLVIVLVINNVLVIKNVFVKVIVIVKMTML